MEIYSLLLDKNAKMFQSSFWGTISSVLLNTQITKNPTGPDGTVCDRETSTLCAPQILHAKRYHNNFQALQGTKS